MITVKQHYRIPLASRLNAATGWLNPLQQNEPDIRRKAVKWRASKEYMC